MYPLWPVTRTRKLIVQWPAFQWNVLVDAFRQRAGRRHQKRGTACRSSRLQIPLVVADEHRLRQIQVMLPLGLKQHARTGFPAKTSLVPAVRAIVDGIKFRAGLP